MWWDFELSSWWGLYEILDFELILWWDKALANLGRKRRYFGGRYICLGARRWTMLDEIQKCSPRLTCPNSHAPIVPPWKCGMLAFVPGCRLLYMIWSGLWSAFIWEANWLSLTSLHMNLFKAESPLTGHWAGDHALRWLLVSFLILVIWDLGFSFYLWQSC